MSNSSLNATKHGCCAVDARLLPGESEKEFRNLERIWNESYIPKTDMQRHLVTECVNADWLLQRATRAYLDIEAQIYAKSANPLNWTDEDRRTLLLFLRYKTAHANTLNRCRKALEDFRRCRNAEFTSASQEDLRKERTIAAKRKNEIPPSTPRTEPTWKEKMQEMRQQAIDLGYTPPDIPR